MAVAAKAFPAKAVSTFSGALDSRAYEPLPEPAFIAVTDIVASTKAIAAGQYKSVNLAGAAGIAALINAIPEWDLPFSFGGDGAVVIVPAEAEDAARSALTGLHGVAARTLALDMRIALIPLSEVRRRGADVQLLYQSLPRGRRLAMLCGGGVSLAERLSKSAEGDAFRILPDPAAADPNLEGLSCRWAPIKPQRGVMLSVLVDGAHQPENYTALFDAVAEAAAGPKSPLDHAPSGRWPPQGVLREASLSAPKAVVQRTISILAQSALGAVSTWTGLTVGGFDGRRYRDSLAAHCDALKFSDSLKMVIDCTPAEADAVTAVLETHCPAAGLEFGVQRSQSALMTCFVQSTQDGGHVHFVDGADGGYAYAAQTLKDKRSVPAVNF